MCGFKRNRSKGEKAKTFIMQKKAGLYSKDKVITLALPFGAYWLLRC